MKNLKTLLILLALTVSVYAQKECTLIWKNVFPVEPKYRMISQDHLMMLEGNMNDMAMIDMVKGNVLWQVNFKKELNVKSAKKWKWLEDMGQIRVTVKGEAKDEEKEVYYDDKSGKSVSQNTKAVVKTKKSYSKERFASYIEIKDKGLELNLTYQKRTFGELISNKPVSITIECSGNKIWSKTLSVKATTSLVDNREEGGEPLIDFSVQGDKVFLVYDGLSVFDLNTGNLLWETTFVNTEYDFGLFKSSQKLGRAANPLATMDGVYVVDLSKGQNCIKKFNNQTGAQIWKSEPFAKDAIVPELSIISNVLVARFGGTIQLESYYPPNTSRGEILKSEPKMLGDFGLKAYNTETGKLLWETTKMKELGDKFSNSITNMVNEDNMLYVASDKNFYAFNSDGKPKFSTPVSKAGLGNPTTMFKNGNNIIIVFVEGIGSFDMSSGKQNYATSTKKALSAWFAGNLFYVWTGSDVFKMDEFVRFDLSNGKIISKMKDTPHPFFSEDGEEFFKIDGEKYFRYKTL